jgi:hypothetical protein
MSDSMIPAAFLLYASDILGDTTKGLSGSNIVRSLAAYAVEYDVMLPHAAYPFEAGNKRTALYENLMKFSPPQQYRIIKELCDHPSLSLVPNPDRMNLKIQLATRYAYLNTDNPSSKINETLIEETRHWLQEHPTALSLYKAAIAKFESGVFHRNILDDLRLSLEKLLQSVFSNHKSLENQIQDVGLYIKSRGGSSEFTNMFVKLIDYYAKYNNTYVKHDDAVIEEEIEFIFEMSSSFMKHLIRLSVKN